ncbi:MAG: glycosyltransferase [Planctomycetes bacterium]|nr:glycosyltransferase [Planctomycetota bacterium]
MLWLAWTLYLAGVLGLLVFAVNNYVLIFLFRRRRKEALVCDAGEFQAFWRREDACAFLPSVTVQLPVFNERTVVERLAECAGRLDYPRDRFEVQVLDDSTDETRALARRVVEGLGARGIRAVHLHRADRAGFKAGALEAGAAEAQGDFLAVFDADFLPPADFLLKTVPYFLGDERLACVQGRWGHLNEDDSLLTRAQALAIDGHFGVEQAARNWNGLPMNFNGSAGVWRKRAIAEAGGWQHDTLTEDMDLSYRAQLAGWRMRYCASAVAPAEIPDTLRALQRQQFRWAKGSIETAGKLLGRIWRGPWRFFERLQATLHVTHYLIHPLMVLSVLAAPWVILLSEGPLPPLLYAICCAGFVVGSLAPSLLYMEATRALCPESLRRRAVLLPYLIVLGLGLCINNTRGVLEALARRKSGFVRTPKQGEGGAPAQKYRLAANWSWPYEILLGCYTFWACGLYVERGYLLVGPYLILYMAGFFYAGLRGLLEGCGARLNEAWRERTRGAARVFRRAAPAKAAGEEPPAASVGGAGLA